LRCAAKNTPLAALTVSVEAHRPQVSDQSGVLKGHDSSRAENAANFSFRGLYRMRKKPQRTELLRAEAREKRRVKGFVGTTEVVPCYKACSEEFFRSLFSPQETPSHRQNHCAAVARFAERSAIAPSNAITATRATHSRMGCLSVNGRWSGRGR